MYEMKSKEYFSYARHEILPFLPENFTKLLDIGCGSGDFGYQLMKEGVEIWGVEPVIHAAKCAQEKITKVFHGYFDDSTDLPVSYFDVITFNDSLEHFPDANQPISLAKKLLNESGVVIASVPNVRYIENIKNLLIQKDWRYTDEGILDHTHLRFFTRKSLIRIFEENGYEVIAIQGIKPHYWSGWKINFLKLLFRKHIEDMKYFQYVITAKPRH